MGQWLYHNSHEGVYRTPFGAVTTGSHVRLRLEIRNNVHIDSVFLRLWFENKETLVPMHPIAAQDISGDPISLWYEVEITVPDHPGLLWYYFILNTKGQTWYYCNNDADFGGEGQVRITPGKSFQITVYATGFTTPAWLPDSVCYQIFVDRFARGKLPKSDYPSIGTAYYHTDWEDTPCYEDGEIYKVELSNDFFGGNLQGVIDKLPYLKDLGINLIYFNPIFVSPSNHKYNTADYLNVDPNFGDNTLFQELCRAAAAHGIRIMLDGVFSHTGSDSIYFNKEGRFASLGAYQSKASPYYPWYRFRKFPDDYEAWWDIETLPNVNELEPSYLDFIVRNESSVVKHWMKLGAKGWRLDVADELPDEFLRILRQEVKALDPTCAIIGEVWEDASRKVSYGKLREFLWGEELDGVTNYPFRTALLRFLSTHGSEFDATSLHQVLTSQYENYPLPALYSSFTLLGTHDVPRVLTLLQDCPAAQYLSRREQANFQPTAKQQELGEKRLRLASLVQMTYPGVPLIYYGDEVGVTGYADPLNRRTFPWGKENKRILNWYKLIIAQRHKYACLRTGHWKSVYHRGDVWGFIRSIASERDIFGRKRSTNSALILINRSQTKEQEIRVPVDPWPSDTAFDVLTDRGKTYPVRNGCIELVIKPLEGKLLVARQD